MYKRYMKRGLDFILSFLAIIILSPAFLVLSIAVKLDSKGPVFFKQERVGLGGNLFQIYKFRSMCVGAEQTGTGQYSFADDPRVTKVGRFIRATSLDELPQLINILRGEMSFVGPRPPLTYHPWPLSDYTPEQFRMFDVRPGITGWAQTHGRKEVEWHERIMLNVWYVDHVSLWLDIKILFMTVFKVLKREDNINHGITVDSNYFEENQNERESAEV
ncbi:MAG: sugar transferase [Eubacterium sp.]